MSKIAIITGAGRGLGRNAALNLAAKGIDTIITYRNSRSEAEAVVAEIEAMGRKSAAFQLDVADTTQFAGFAEAVREVLAAHWDRLDFDYLLNNAGHGDLVPFQDVTEAQFDAMFNVHVKGVYFLTQKLLPLMAQGGRIINYSSGLTRVTFPGMSAYIAAKGAVETLTVALARELGPQGITVNAVAPGAIETDFLGGAVRDMPELNKQFADMIALGRVCRPDDIGRMLASFLSGDNGWITGQRIEVSGGQVI
jgi:Dehydrogenases with different specificities (related to short-chain alcohol dehydrogenases)